MIFYFSHTPRQVIKTPVSRHAPAKSACLHSRVLHSIHLDKRGEGTKRCRCNHYRHGSGKNCLVSYTTQWMQSHDIPPGELHQDLGWPEPYIYGVHTICLAGNSSNIPSFTVRTYNPHLVDASTVLCVDKTKRHCCSS